MQEDNAQRLAAVASLNLIDTPPEERFDRIVRLAARVTRSPIAVIAFLTAERQWFKAQIGLRVGQIPRAWSFCAYTNAEGSPFVIENTILDARFRNNPLVLADPHIRFYAGVSVRDPNGFAVATLCVMDSEPRKLRASELQALSDLAEVVGREIVTSAADQ
ncbi:MAG: GAF domain-containing protein [Pseudomonadota bacterium]